MAKVTDMTKGKPTILLLSFAFPLILGNLGQQLYTITDAIIVGQGVGVKALASVGATDWVYWLFFWVIQAMTQGFGTRIAYYYGAKNFAKLNKAITMSIYLCLLIGIILTIISTILAEPLLHILKTPNDIFAGASSYVRILFAGILIVMAFNMAAAMLRAFGDGKTPLIAMGIAATTNILLDLLFILVFHWGIIGAAIATLIAQFISFAYCFFAIKNLKFLQINASAWKWNARIVYELCMMGLPLGLQYILIAIGGMIVQSAINAQGFIFVAGFTATNKIYGLLECSAFALNYATNIYVAQNYGAKLYTRIRRGIKKATIISVIISMSIGILMLLFGKNLLQLFIDVADKNASAVLDVAHYYLTVLSCMLFVLYLLHIYRSVLQGLGNSFYAMFSGILEFIIRVIMILFLTKILGTYIIFFAESSAWLGAAIFIITICVIKVNKLPKDNLSSGA